MASPKSQCPIPITLPQLHRSISSISLHLRSFQKSSSPRHRLPLSRNNHPLAGHDFGFLIQSSMVKAGESTVTCDVHLLISLRGPVFVLPMEFSPLLLSSTNSITHHLERELWMLWNPLFPTAAIGPGFESAAMEGEPVSPFR